ncbi:MAG: secondary thiamine-phosphate synthase enzyme YjbQ [Actinomycetota bacterium]
MQTFTVKTTGRTDLHDITREVARAVEGTTVSEGACLIYIPHTTAGITINENADPAVRVDIESALERLVPWSGPYRHSEGNAAAHVKASMMGFSAMIPISGGRLVLGTWQGIYLCEFDGPRTRKVHVQVLPSI